MKKVDSKRNGVSSFPEASGSRSQTEASPSRRVGQKSLGASGKFARQLFILKYTRAGMPGSLKKYSKKTRGGKSGRKTKQVLSSLELGRQGEVKREYHEL